MYIVRCDYFGTSVLLEVAADVINLSDAYSTKIRFRGMLKPGFVPFGRDRIEFWITQTELLSCPTEQSKTEMLKHEFCKAFAKIQQDYDPTHELSNWALLLVIRGLMEELTLGSEENKKRKIYEESRKTKNIEWKALADCKGYLSKTVKSRHKGSVLHHIHKLTNGDITCATQILWAIVQDTTFNGHFIDCRTAIDVKRETRKLAYLDRVKEVIHTKVGAKPCKDSKAYIGTCIALLAPPEPMSPADLNQFGRDIGVDGDRHLRGYILQAIHARWAYDKYWYALQSRGTKSFAAGDTVATCNGGKGKYIRENADGSITIEMEESLTHITWPSVKAARLRHSPPSLLQVSPYGREANVRQNVTSNIVHDAMQAWLIANSTPSPMVRDTCKRRIGLRQYELMRKLYRHRTFDELWADFKVDINNSLTLSKCTRVT